MERTYPLHSKDQGVQGLELDQPILRELVQDLGEQRELQGHVATDTHGLEWIVQDGLPFGGVKGIVVMGKTVLHNHILGKGHVASTDGQWGLGLAGLANFGDQDVQLRTDNGLQVDYSFSGKERIQSFSADTMKFGGSSAQDRIFVAKTS